MLGTRIHCIYGTDGTDTSVATLTSQQGLYKYTAKLASPAVDHNRVVSTPHLHLGHLLNDVSDGLQVGATSISVPVHNVEL